MDLVQLVYHSRPVFTATGSARLTAFREIQSTAKARNQSVGVGGFLVLTKSHFIQLLEGERAAVMATYARIRKDARHRDVTLLDITPSRQRQFADWGMGAIHDAMVIQEALLSIGIAGDQELNRLGAKQITSVLSALAERPKVAA